MMHLLATQDSLSDNVLVHLKSYKYSSVDKSLISRYILKHYVPFNPPPVPYFVAVVIADEVIDTQVECIRGATAIMAGSKHGHPTGLCFCRRECGVYRTLHAGSSWAGRDILTQTFNGRPPD